MKKSFSHIHMPTFICGRGSRCRNTLPRSSSFWSCSFFGGGSTDIGAVGASASPTGQGMRNGDEAGRESGDLTYPGAEAQSAPCVGDPLTLKRPLCG